MKKKISRLIISFFLMVIILINEMPAKAIALQKTSEYVIPDVLKTTATLIASDYYLVGGDHGIYQAEANLEIELIETVGPFWTAVEMSISMEFEGESEHLEEPEYPIIAVCSDWSPTGSAIGIEPQTTVLYDGIVTNVTATYMAHEYGSETYFNPPPLTISVDELD